jgi:hypothetical protein
VELTRIPGVGISIANDLRELGYHSFEQLCRNKGVRVDRCVLYVFRCATYFAETDEPDPRLLEWWNWKDSRRADLNARAASG